MEPTVDFVCLLCNPSVYHWATSKMSDTPMTVDAFFFRDLNIKYMLDSPLVDFGNGYSKEPLVARFATTPWNTAWVSFIWNSSMRTESDAAKGSTDHRRVRVALARQVAVATESVLVVVVVVLAVVVVEEMSSLERKGLMCNAVGSTFILLEDMFWLC